MKWIKLIDKKPETWYLKPVRFIHTKMPILDIEKLLAERPNSTLSIVEWLDESTPSPSRGLQDRNFMVRLKANIDRRMTDTGVKEMMLDGSSAKKIFSERWTAFFESLEDITLETLQGKEPNPISSRGFTEEEIIGLKKLREYFGEHDKTTHEHYLYAVVNKLLASLQQSGGKEYVFADAITRCLQSKVEGEEWVKCEEGNPLPDYDVPVLWLQENGNMVVEALDKDGNPWIFEGQTFEGSYMGNKATHWRYLPAPPKQ